MGRLFQARELSLVVGLVAALAATTGCTFLRARGKDALDMFDMGFTFSTKPQFGLYGNCPFTVPGGYSKVDGYFVGLGGGKVGVMDHHQDSAGLLLWAREDVEWSKGEDDEEKVGTYQMGPLGLAVDSEGNTTYRPQCAHYLHLGFIGVTGNLNYREWADFLVGWFGVDINKDDVRAASLPARRRKLDDISDRIARPHEGLQLLARTGKETYALDEPIVLDVQLVNRTGRRGRRRSDRPRDLSVYFEPFAKTPKGGSAEWLFKFDVFEVYGNRARYHSPRFKVSAEARAEYYHCLTVPPGAFVGRRFEFPPASERNWLEPGSYFFLVSYEVTEDYPYVIIRPELTQAQAVALGKEAYSRVWTGKLYADLVVFNVKRKKRFGIF